MPGWALLCLPKGRGLYSATPRSQSVFCFFLRTLILAVSSMFRKKPAHVGGLLRRGELRDSKRLTYPASSFPRSTRSQSNVNSRKREDRGGALNPAPASAGGFGWVRTSSRRCIRPGPSSYNHSNLFANFCGENFHFLFRCFCLKGLKLSSFEALTTSCPRFGLPTVGCATSCAAALPYVYVTEGRRREKAGQGKKRRWSRH